MELSVVVGVEPAAHAAILGDLMRKLRVCVTMEGFMIAEKLCFVTQVGGDAPDFIFAAEELLAGTQDHEVLI